MTIFDALVISGQKATHHLGFHPIQADDARLHEMFAA